MATRSDGTQVPHSDAIELWADAAYEVLKDVATRYNSVITYADLRDKIQAKTGISTEMVLPNWIGSVLERAAQKAVDNNEPPLTSLCVKADGLIGEGYHHAPKIVTVSPSTDTQQLAAEHRLLCYQAFAKNLPSDVGKPTLTPKAEIQRRKLQQDDSWLDEVIARGYLNTSDHVPFETHVQVARLFGRNMKGHQRATIRINESTHIWFPKMFSNGDWENSLSDDGQTITMRPSANSQYSDVMTRPPERDIMITFGKLKQGARTTFYEFLGVFERDPEHSNESQWVYQFVSESIQFNGTGWFDFPDSRLALGDDQNAEVAEVDDDLVQKYQQQIANHDYRVEDQFGITKVRGSAQKSFAESVKDNYGWSCAVTGISTREFLVASHIVPWKEDPAIRLDPTNGICLSTFVDRAFDAKFLSITPDGRTSVRWEKIEDDPILKSELERYDNVELATPSTHPPDPEKLKRRFELGY